jgi:excinuclease ABC subunit B
MLFELKADFNPKGDQPQAINKLVEGLRKGYNQQVLFGITGSGKTFSIANVIQNIKTPTIVIEPNKTLAAQIYSELKSFFPDNAVEYYVSYYDYYQPEAYVPTTDTYIAKDYSINEEVERLRLSSMYSLSTRKDVIVVATVSCLYPAGTPEDFESMTYKFYVDQEISREELISNLVNLQYERNDFDFHRGTFRVRGDTIDLHYSYKEEIVRIEFFGDKIEKISILEPYNYTIKNKPKTIHIFSATQFITPTDKINKALITIEKELEERIKELRSLGKHLYAERLEKRTRYDIEMLREMGYCGGIENYSRHFDGRKKGEKPNCLLNYFKSDFLIVVDESHLTLPQIRGMHAGDYKRKKNLIDFGFRLPSAYDNRPLTFEEFKKYLNNVIYVSATPGKYEFENSEHIVEQIIRPTGLIDPKIEIRKTKGQVDELIKEIREASKKNERVLVTTLTKRMAEDLSEYLIEAGIKAEYLHSEVDTIDRIRVLRNLRKGKYDVVVGINLLREGLDLPEVSLVAILDADKEGFLRSDKSLIQIIGRASRNINGRVILFADEITESMKRAIDENNRRRSMQIKFNQDHGITPETIIKQIKDLVDEVGEEIQTENKKVFNELVKLSDEDIDIYLMKLTEEMKVLAEKLEFEKAAEIRDKIRFIEKKLIIKNKK